MRKIPTAVVLLAISSSAFGQTWTQQTSGTTDFVNAVHFIDETRGWTTTTTGTIRRTTDGGVTWSVLTSGTSGLNSVRFLDANTGWAAGLSHIRRTADGGSSYTILNFGSSDFVNALSPVSSSQAWAAGSQNFCNPCAESLYRVTFSGSSFSFLSFYDYTVPTSSTSYPSLNDIFFTSPDDGWAVGAKGRIIRISGGSGSSPTRTSQTSGTTVSLNGIHMLDASTGWIVGASGTVLRTTNGGATWTPQSSGTTTNLNAVHFVNVNRGWIVGSGGVILSTSNGGSTWTPEVSGVTGSLVDVFFPSPSIGFAVGANGVILKQVNTSTSTLTITTSSPLPSGTVNSAYSQTLQASGGTSPYTWTLASGSLPVGLSLAGSSGVVSGTPTATGTSSFRIRVTDAAAATAEKDFSLTMATSAPPPPPPVGTFVVNSTLDAVDATRGDGICATAGGVCTLRAAIQEANALTTARAITLPAGTYTLTIAGRDEFSAATGDLNIGSGKDVTINGVSAASTIIDANGIDRAFQSFGGTLTLNDVTVRNGNSGTSFGGCFYMSSGSASGSALTLTRSAVTGCSAGSNSAAGIIIFGSTSPSSLTLTDTTIAQNSTTGSGGGVYLSSNTSATIVRSTISGNSALFGAGLNVFGPAGSASTLTMANTTISGNTATSSGGGLYFSGGDASSAATLTNVTIASNSSGGAFGAVTFTDAGQFRIRNTVIANSAGATPQNCSTFSGGVMTDLGNNVEFPGTTCGFGLASDRRANPLLGGLADNGGLTQTHSLGSGSPAIDIGDTTTCAASPVAFRDQRGFVRPASCDAGAYEFGAVAPPTMSLDRTALVFGAVSDVVRLTSQTSPQTVRLTQSGAGTVSWTAASTSPWLVVSPTSGSGAATLTVSVQFAAGLAATQTGTIALTFTGASNTSATIAATLNIATGTVPPVGGFDTPSDGSTVTGSIAVTGWALDNIEVTRVQIQRDAHPSDPPGAAVNGKVFVGDASFVEGARPDVQTANPSVPLNSRAGWGYLMLTRGLIWDGKGPFKLYALATDKEGNTVTLGSKTITINNAVATKPFGAIDTPGQGATASGVYPNTGWALTPNAGATIPASGVRVSIDSVFLPGVPSVSDRADITTGFPTFNTTGAGRGLFIDTTQYSNGTHTIGWVVTDSTGQADGVGSRFFNVSNGALLTNEPAAPMLSSRADVDAVAPAGDGGRRAVHVEELDRVEIQLDDAGGSRYLGYMGVGGRLAALPIGSHLEGSTFTWQLAAGFLGRYELVFVRERGGVLDARQDVRITVHPQGTFTRAQVVIDTPAREQALDDPFRLTGWALDPASPYSTGISTVHVWAYPVRGGAPTFMGSATPAGRRPDVGAIYGERFQDTGFELDVSGLTPGTYDLAVFAWSDGVGAFLPARVIRIRVR
jgi:CSLREA domain-containing protein